METKKLIEALRWREDADRGEMISKSVTPTDSSHFDKHHYAFAGSISQKTLDLICEAANTWWKLNSSKLRISNSMGELIPGFAQVIHNRKGIPIIEQVCHLKNSDSDDTN